MAENWEAAPEEPDPRRTGARRTASRHGTPTCPTICAGCTTTRSPVKRHYLGTTPPLRATKDEDKLRGRANRRGQARGQETKDEPEDEPTDTEDEPVARPRRPRSADKELWLTSLREIWVQGEDAWRAEFLEEESDKLPHATGLAGVADETERLRTVAVNRAARTARKANPGGISDENFGVAVLDAAEVIASGKVEGPTIPDDLGDNISAGEFELQKALRTKLKRPARRAVVEETVEP
jgi:hypothetical protein